MIIFKDIEKTNDHILKFRKENIIKLIVLTPVDNILAYKLSLLLPNESRLVDNIDSIY